MLRLRVLSHVRDRLRDVGLELDLEWDSVRSWDLGLGLILESEVEVLKLLLINF